MKKHVKDGIMGVVFVIFLAVFLPFKYAFKQPRVCKDAYKHHELEQYDSSRLIDELSLCLEENLLDRQRNRALVVRAYHKEKLSDLEGAIADYDQAIALDPEDAYAYRRRGRAKRIAGNLDGAVQDYTTAIGIDPNYINAFQGRAKTYVKLGKKAEAEVDVRKVRALDQKAWVPKLE